MFSSAWQPDLTAASTYSCGSRYFFTLTVITELEWTCPAVGHLSRFHKEGHSTMEAQQAGWTRTISGCRCCPHAGKDATDTFTTGLVYDAPFRQEGQIKEAVDKVCNGSLMDPSNRPGRRGNGHKAAFDQCVCRSVNVFVIFICTYTRTASRCAC